MRTYEEKARILPVVAEVDVLVVGGGPAGFSAAVCAAREGARTMLVEQSGQVGGVATTGMMSHWGGETLGGFYKEILERSRDLDLSGRDIYTEEERRIEPETLKICMLDMLDEADVSLRLYTFACEAIVEADRIKGIIIESKTGREVILANVVIDASGDGDVAALAGADYIKGRETDGKMQPMTVMFKMGGVDTDRVTYVHRFEDTYELPDGNDLQGYARTKIPFPAGHVLIYQTTLPGVVTLNMTNCIQVDGTNAVDLTEAEKTCRRQIPYIVDFLKKEIEGFEEAFLISSASIVGVRETRHFIGEKTITEDDIMVAKEFEDWAAANLFFNFDVHNLDGAGLDETGCQKHFSQNRRYTIPYGCFIPKKINGLMMAGRNISGTHMAHSNYRVMSICANMGQSVGIAAAMSANMNIEPRDLPIEALQEKLTKYGASPMDSTVL